MVLSVLAIFDSLPDLPLPHDILTVQPERLRSTNMNLTNAQAVQIIEQTERVCSLSEGLALLLHFGMHLAVVSL